ncbi:redoxin domain-containing protein [Sphingobacterium hungaricum]
MKTIVIFLTLFISLNSFSQEKFTISGRVQSIPFNTILYLSYKINGKTQQDSIKILQDQNFQFTGEIALPVLAKLSTSQDEHSNILTAAEQISFYLADGQANIVGETLQNASVEVTNPIAKDYEAYKLMERPIRDSLELLVLSIKTNVASQKDPMKYIQEVKEKILNTELDRKNLKYTFIKEYPKSYVSFDFLNELVSYDNLNELGFPAFNAFPDEIKSSEKGKELAAKMELLKPFSNGSVAPEFSLPDTLGNQVALSSFKGKYVFIDFWASWCLPCRFENPNVIAAYNKYKDKNFTVLGISIDEAKDKEKWLKAIKDDKVQQWQHVSDLIGWKSPVATLYKIQAIPRNFLIDPDGKIVGSDLRGPALNERLEKILN